MPRYLPLFISVVNLTISLPAYRLRTSKRYFDVCFDRYGDHTRFLVLVWVGLSSLRQADGRTRDSSEQPVAVLYLTAFTVISGIFTVPLSLTAIFWSLESSDAPHLGEWQILGNEILKSPH